MKKEKRIIIGILGETKYDSDNFEIVSIYDSYSKIILSKNCIPFMIPPIQDVKYLETKNCDIPELNDKEKQFYREMIDMCDGILLPGGDRIYGYYEFIVNYALEKNIPILGTCLGMQLLANIDNKCNCLVRNENDEHKKKRVNYAHDINIVEDTLLYEIIGEKKMAINSSHLYHVSKVNNFLVSAYSLDGLIEAIELPTKRFVLGVQWHPEKMVEYDLNANKIINRFIEECIKYKNEKILSLEVCH